jgi:poly(3-hydroxybutyrate) depolymerase
VKGDLDDAESHRKFYDEYNAVLDLPAEYYLDTIRTVFQDHLLPRAMGRGSGRARPRPPEDIREGALFTIEGELDDISGRARPAAHKLCPATFRQGPPAAPHGAEGAGHYGIFSGRRWRENDLPAGARLHPAHAGRVESTPGRTPKKKPTR